MSGKFYCDEKHEAKLLLTWHDSSPTTATGCVRKCDGESQSEVTFIGRKCPNKKILWHEIIAIAYEKY
jgi:hypothetical protein